MSDFVFPLSDGVAETEENAGRLEYNAANEVQDAMLEISSTAVPIFRFMSRMSSMIWAWMVTSNAVVGSSAMSSSGWFTRAMAIITRWRMPPESRWGYSLYRRSTSGKPTWRMTSKAFFLATSLESPWMRAFSAICRPTFIRGFKAVMGSWKIMAMFRPRYWFHCSSYCYKILLPSP